MSDGGSEHPKNITYSQYFVSIHTDIIYQAAYIFWQIQTVKLKRVSFQLSPAGSALSLVRGGVKEGRQICAGVSYMSSDT